MQVKWSRWENSQHHFNAVLILVLLPILANGLVLLGMVNPDPAIEISGLGQIVTAPIFPGGGPDWFDGATGTISQPLAVLSARDWLHGIVPWWNPDTGAGMPLGAEMAGFSFFLPFLFLFIFHNGLILFRVAIQVLSGLAMYGFLAGLKLDRAAALMGAALFTLSATFFLAPQAIGPLPFLPLLLLGVDSAARSVRGEQTLAWLCIPIAVAYSFYGSFPEVAFFNSLFAGAWVVWQCAGLPAESRWRFLARITAQIVLGVMLTLPLLVPFLSYAKLSFLGPHETYFSHSSVPVPLAPLSIFPFAYGEIDLPTLNDPNVAMVYPLYGFGGWFGLSPVFLAVAALIRPGTHRGLIYFLSGFIGFWLLRCTGFAPAIFITNLIPFVAKTNAVRFCWPSLEVAMFILASLCLDGWIKSGAASRRTLIVTSTLVATMSFVLLMIAVQFLMNIHFSRGSSQLIFAAGICLGSVLLCMFMGFLLGRTPSRRHVGMVVWLMIGQSFITFFLLQLPAPRSANLDMGGVKYLQKNLGLGRIFSLQALNFDYPAAYDISAINSFALPVDKRWTNYIHTQLDSNADPIVFNGFPSHVPGSNPIQALNENFPKYQALGLKYVLTQTGDFPFESRKSLPLRDSTAEIITIAGGQSLSGTVPGNLVGLPQIDSVDVKIGTFFGKATGTLVLKVCQNTRCAQGVIDLSHARDDSFDKFTLDQKLSINPHATLSYDFHHSDGRAVAIWIYRFDGLGPANLSIGQLKPGFSPWFQFDVRLPGITSQLVFRDSLMDIYQVPGATPFFSASASCTLTQEDFNNTRADCSQPARLTRLEAWYPGWHVQVNGVTSTPALTGGLFQSTDLPAGHSNIRFFYIPVGTRWSVTFASLAFLIWIAQLFLKLRSTR